VGVVRTGVNLELGQLLAPKGVLRQHAAHGTLHELGGTLGEQLGVAALLDAPGYPLWR